MVLCDVVWFVSMCVRVLVCLFDLSVFVLYNCVFCLWFIVWCCMAYVCVCFLICACLCSCVFMNSPCVSLRLIHCVMLNGLLSFWCVCSFPNELVRWDAPLKNHETKEISMVDRKQRFWAEIWLHV